MESSQRHLDSATKEERHLQVAELEDAHEWAREKAREWPKVAPESTGEGFPDPRPVFAALEVLERNTGDLTGQANMLLEDLGKLRAQLERIADFSKPFNQE